MSTGCHVTRTINEPRLAALRESLRDDPCCHEASFERGLWARDLQRAHRFAREPHAGMVWINSYERVNPGSPFGGVGQSGYGREMGFDAMREYTQVKSIWVNVDAQIPAWYPR